MSNQDLAVLTKKKIVKLAVEDREEKQEIVLYPLGWKHFNEAIQLINKYWGCYQKTKDEYDNQINSIIHETKEDENHQKRKLLIETLDSQFNEIGSIVKNILESNQENLAEDIEKVVKFCLREALDFASLNLGEVTCLLTSAIEVNMDFFEENLKNSELFEPINQEIPKSGESKSAA